MPSLETLATTAGFESVYRKVMDRTRLDRDDGLALYASHDLFAIGGLADIVRERRHGDVTTYIYNQHLNYSNICSCLCKFCAFGKRRGEPGAFELSAAEIGQKVRERLDEPIAEIHLVGSVHPDLPYEYYLSVLRAIKAVRPQVHIQAFTMVEIDHLAGLAGQSVEETLCDLRTAGLDSIAGGGAEIFSARVRNEICPNKISGDRWLNIAKIAHGMGIHSNATMLYGHIETVEERVDHLIALRRAQDESGGFLTFIPLAFHPQHTGLSQLPPTCGVDDLKTIAISRLLLDNIPHIKAYWVMLGIKLAQVALSFGADDLDGTVVEEKITAMAGGTSGNYIAAPQMEKLIRDAGRTPVRRDTLYRPV